MEESALYLRKHIENLSVRKVIAGYTDSNFFCVRFPIRTGMPAAFRHGLTDRTVKCPVVITHAPSSRPTVPVYPACQVHSFLAESVRPSLPASLSGPFRAMRNRYHLSLIKKPGFPASLEKLSGTRFL